MVDYSSTFEVPPMRRLDIRRLSQDFREILKVQGPYFPILGLLEIMNPLFNIDYDYVDDAMWGRYFGKNMHAQYDLDKKCIFIKESVYLGAYEDRGRDRFTIAHEIAHAILIRDNKVKFCRTAQRSTDIPLYKNPEWQADCLAGELLIPYSLCKDMSIERIVSECKVSYSAAFIQKKKF